MYNRRKWSYLFSLVVQHIQIHLQNLRIQCYHPNENVTTNIYHLKIFHLETFDYRIFQMTLKNRTDRLGSVNMYIIMKLCWIDVNLKYTLYINRVHSHQWVFTADWWQANIDYILIKHSSIITQLKWKWKKSIVSDLVIPLNNRIRTLVTAQYWIYYENPTLLHDQSVLSIKIVKVEFYWFIQQQQKKSHIHQIGEQERMSDWIVTMKLKITQNEWQFLSILSQLFTQFLLFVHIIFKPIKGDRFRSHFTLIHFLSFVPHPKNE